MCLSVSGIFHLAKFPPCSYLSQMTGFPLLRLNNMPLYMYTTISLVIHPWTSMMLVPLGYCKNAAVNMDLQILLPDSAFNLFGYIPRSEITES